MCCDSLPVAERSFFFFRLPRRMVQRRARAKGCLNDTVAMRCGRELKQF